MLIPLRPGELQRLIPAVATGTQFRVSLGNPQEVLQRLMIAAIGGVITFLIYNQAQLGSAAAWRCAGRPERSGPNAHTKRPQR